MTQEKIQDRFRNELPAPYGELAAANVTLENKYNWKDIREHTSIADVLMWAFWWDKSNEAGEERSNLYWSMIHESLADEGGIKKVEDILGSFNWSDFRVKVWKNVLCVGCQTVPRAEVFQAMQRQSFTRKNGVKVNFNEGEFNYDGSYSRTEEQMNELFSKLDELGF